MDEIIQNLMKEIKDLKSTTEQGFADIKSTTEQGFADIKSDITDIKSDITDIKSAITMMTYEISATNSLHAKMGFAMEGIVQERVARCTELKWGYLYHEWRRDCVEE